MKIVINVRNDFNDEYIKCFDVAGNSVEECMSYLVSGVHAYEDNYPDISDTCLS